MLRVLAAITSLGMLLMSTATTHDPRDDRTVVPGGVEVTPKGDPLEVLAGQTGVPATFYLVSFRRRIVNLVKEGEVQFASRPLLAKAAPLAAQPLTSRRQSSAPAISLIRSRVSESDWRP